VSDDASRFLKNGKNRIVIGNPHLLRLRPDAGRFFPEFRHRQVIERANGKPAREIATAQERQIKREPQCEIHHIVFLDRKEDGHADIFPFPKERALAEMATAIAFGTPEFRRARMAHYRNLLKLPVMRIEYSDLDEAVDCLENIVRSDS
jgi:hypothetical protein